MPDNETPVETVKPGDIRIVDSVPMVYNGFNWLSVKDTMQLVVQSHLRDTMEDLLAEADDPDSEPDHDFARTLADIVTYEIFDCALEHWK